MKKRIINSILIVTAVLFGVCLFAFADESFFVNNGDSVLPRFFEGVYAIGGEGTSLLSRDRVYALSADGLQLLGTANATGGGGLRYDGHSVRISDDHIKVGLDYYYSESRDSSVSSAVLENTSGKGFLFGHLSSDGELEVCGSTELSRITVKASVGTSVWISSAGSSDPLFVSEITGRDNYLMIRPVSDSGSTLISYSQRRYFGDFGFSVLGNDKLTVMNYVDIEHYTMGVCACEMSENWPLEALKAQAVAARTYAQKMRGSSVYYYSCGFDVTADTYSQAYHGYANVGPNIENAVLSTANEYLTYHDALIDALYSASDGGATESNVNVFGNNAHPYLTGIIDPYEASSSGINPYSSWSVTMSPTQLGSKVGIGAVKTVTPTYSDTGNVIKLEFISTSGQTATVIRDSCRTVLGLKSIHYDITNDAAGNFVFTGGGFGHNLGMSQWGAYAMAKYFEKDYKSILGFYYTGVGLSYGELK